MFICIKIKLKVLLFPIDQWVELEEKLLVQDPGMNGDGSLSSLHHLLEHLK
jgi:hypothetical protein